MWYKLINWARQRRVHPRAGEVPPPFLYLKGVPAVEKVLSVFCDESGDFGEYDPKCPWYLVTLILHEQSNSIEEQIKKLESSLTNEHVPLNQPIHTGPLIRREPPI